MTLETKPKFRTPTRQSELSAPSQPRTRLWASDQLQDQMAGRMGEASLSRKWEFWLWKSASWSSEKIQIVVTCLTLCHLQGALPTDRNEHCDQHRAYARSESLYLYFCYKSRNRIKIHSVSFGKFAYIYIYDNFDKNMFQFYIIRYHSIPKKVRMRVVRNTGSTADVVGLGEDLQLRIEIDQDSAFGLFARTLEARWVSYKINPLGQWNLI